MFGGAHGYASVSGNICVLGRGGTRAKSCASGANNGAAPGAVPQMPNTRSVTSNARVASVAGGIKFLAQGVTNGIARIAKTHKLHAASRKGKRPNDYTHPSNTTTADPPVPRPNESPCTVTLFSGFQFTSFTYPTFQYAPPAGCHGPWAKVVFEGDFSVNAGRQFDRSGSIWIAGTNIYFGTTAEPSANLGPSWHVERDITDLSAILTAPSTGEVVLGNVVDSTYTGVITASGTLQFYPANAANPAPTVADDVYPLSGGPLGDNQYPSSQQQPLTGTFTLPRNVEAAYLDVYFSHRSATSSGTRASRTISPHRFPTAETPHFVKATSQSTAVLQASHRFIPGSLPAASIPISGAPFPVSKRSSSGPIA